jgi:hypothetical protein
MNGRLRGGRHGDREQGAEGGKGALTVHGRHARKGVTIVSHDASTDGDGRQRRARGATGPVGGLW